MLTEEKVIHSREVMGWNQFLGDAGGLYGSLMILGTVLNFLFSGNNQNLQLLDHFFFINEASYDSNSKASWLESFKSGRKGVFKKLVFGTILRKLPLMSANRRLDRLKRIVKKTDDHVEKALDVRTMIVQQSLLLALTRVLIEPANTHLLKFQRGGRHINM